MLAKWRNRLATAAAITFGLWVIAHAQQVTPVPPPTAAVCAYNTSPPTIASGNFAYVQCTATGQLLLH